MHRSSLLRIIISLENEFHKKRYVVYRPPLQRRKTNGNRPAETFYLAETKLKLKIKLTKSHRIISNIWLTKPRQTILSAVYHNYIIQPFNHDIYRVVIRLSTCSLFEIHVFYTDLNTQHVFCI